MNVDGRKSLALAKIRALDCRLVVTTVFAIGLGGAAAWATTGQFAVLMFLAIGALGIVAQIGLGRVGPSLPWVLAPLLAVAIYRTQSGRLDRTVIWLLLAFNLVWGFGYWRAHIESQTMRVTDTRRVMDTRRAMNTRRTMSTRLLLTAYGILLTGVAVGGIPAWCLLCLLPAPLARRALASPDVALDAEWMAATGLLLIAGYVIKGLIR